MSDLIDRQATINAFFMELCFNKDREYAIGYKGIEKIINGLPSAGKTDEWEEPEINPCRGCKDYDGRGGCISNGGCGQGMVNENE